MDKKESTKYTDLSTVETGKNFLINTDLPEGAYGSPFRKNEPVQNKSTPWRDEQQFTSNFTYEFRTLHQNLPRQMDGAHPTHDDPERDEEEPYTNT